MNCSQQTVTCLARTWVWLRPQWVGARGARGRVSFPHFLSHWIQGAICLWANIGITEHEGQCCAFHRCDLCQRQTKRPYQSLTQNTKWFCGKAVRFQSQPLAAE